MDIFQHLSDVPKEVTIAIITVVAGAIAYYYRDWRRRRMLRQMLFAEICSFIAVIETIQLESTFELLIKVPPEKWAYSSQENYFTLFEANASDLGLDGETVGHVVACYEFMKGARDARRAAANWGADNAELCRAELRRTALLVAHSLEEADLATRCLLKKGIATTPMKEAMDRILHSKSIRELAEDWWKIALSGEAWKPESSVSKLHGRGRA